MAELNEQMINNINNYADQIKTFEKFYEAVRQNPGQYIGYVGNKGFINMVREIFQNSVDEMMKHDSPANYIEMIFDERTHTVVVSDNGELLPHLN